MFVAVKTQQGVTLFPVKGSIIDVLNTNTWIISCQGRSEILNNDVDLGELKELLKPDIINPNAVNDVF